MSKIQNIFNRLIQKISVTHKEIESKDKKIVTSNPTPNPNVLSTGTVVSSIGAAAGTSAIGIAGQHLVNTGVANPPIFTGHYGTTIGSTSFQFYPPTNIISLSNYNGQEIVRLNRDGTVTWNNGIQIDEAAEAFGRTLSLSAEIAAGVNAGIKRKMRDTVFEEIISIAKEKGSLSAEDLTFLWESSKIIDKLKGARE